MTGEGLEEVMRYTITESLVKQQRGCMEEWTVWQAEVVFVVAWRLFGFVWSVRLVTRVLLRSCYVPGVISRECTTYWLKLLFLLEGGREYDIFAL